MSLGMQMLLLIMQGRLCLHRNLMYVRMPHFSLHNQLWRARPLPIIIDRHKAYY